METRRDAPPLHFCSPFNTYFPIFPEPEEQRFPFFFFTFNVARKSERGRDESGPFRRDFCRGSRVRAMPRWGSATVAHRDSARCRAIISGYGIIPRGATYVSARPSILSPSGTTALIPREIDAGSRRRSSLPGLRALQIHSSAPDGVPSVGSRSCPSPPPLTPLVADSLLLASFWESRHTVSEELLLTLQSGFDPDRHVMHPFSDAIYFIHRSVSKAPSERYCE